MLLLEDLVRSGSTYAAMDHYDRVAIAARVVRLPSGRPLLERVRVTWHGRPISAKCAIEGGLVEAARRELLVLIERSAP